MQCPKCTAAMEQVTFGGVEVERCIGCQGLWFDSGTLAPLIAMKGSDVIDPGSVEVGKMENRVDRISCPKCHKAMISMVDLKQHHIWFESCKVCQGLFLDAGEFRDLKHHTLADYVRDLFTKERN